ncbi:hypothetical protein K439DRAFT_1183697 [Ramaria rubella]|nr:hypothetical protein K439DRAFT_1183697 [Ramaria rubella]
MCPNVLMVVTHWQIVLDLNAEIQAPSLKLKHWQSASDGASDHSSTLSESDTSTIAVETRPHRPLSTLPDFEREEEPEFGQDTAAKSAAYSSDEVYVEDMWGELRKAAPPPMEYGASNVERAAQGNRFKGFAERFIGKFTQHRIMHSIELQEVPVGSRSPRHTSNL